MPHRPYVFVASLMIACGGPTPQMSEPDLTRPAEPEAKAAAQTEGQDPAIAEPPAEAVAPASEPKVYEVSILPGPDLPWESGPMWGPSGLHPKNLSASSTLAPQGKNTYGVDHLSDDDPLTAWVEGAEGNGEGERLSFVWVNDPAMVCTSLMIRNGYQKSAKLFRANGRVKDLKISIDGRVAGTATLADSWEPQALYLEAEDGQRIELEIMSVYPGDSQQDTALSELVQLCMP